MVSILPSHPVDPGLIHGIAKVLFWEMFQKNCFYEKIVDAAWLIGWAAA